MAMMYSNEQLNRVLFYGDLVNHPLDNAEGRLVIAAIEAAGVSPEDALRSLPPHLASKARSLLTQSLKLSLELNKLAQRGVNILFAEETPFDRVSAFFELEPILLFALGPSTFLLDETIPIYVSSSSFLDSGGRGILLADRSFDAMLRDKRVTDAVATSKLLILSDAYRIAAHVVDAGMGAQGVSQGVLPQAEPRKLVLISGSRSQKVIPRNVQDSLKAITSQGFGVLIGDSNAGVDNEVIDYLRCPLYRNVCIYTISAKPRIKVEPEWGVKVVEADSSLKPQQRQMVKDRAMGERADWGLAVFNPLETTRYGTLRVSAGTLRNCVQMLLDGKQVKLFYQYEGDMKTRNLKTLKDLEDVIASYQLERVVPTEADLILAQRGVSPSDNPSRIKCEKIRKKYLELLKDEQALRGEKNTAQSGFQMQTALPLYV